MDQIGCPCCSRAIAAEWEFDVRPMRLYRAWRPDSHRSGSNIPLCESCAEWLGELAAAARTPDGTHRVLGGPSAGNRKLVFEDQCQVCCEMPSRRAAKLAWVSPRGKRLELFVCTGCEAWLTALASDGRTVRGAGDRDIDGPYGHWPHPNLRGLKVHLDVEDYATRALIAETCRAMGMELTAEPADLLITQATASGHAARKIRERKGIDITSIVVAGLRARHDLAQALEAGARCWATVPITPQQLTAALSRASRGESASWDAETCLPIVEADQITRPVVQCEPLPGTEMFELAWLLKRFSRGYDDIGWHNGTILVIPRTPSDHVPGVAARLSVLVDGRGTFAVVGPRELAPSVRFEAAG